MKPLPRPLPNICCPCVGVLHHYSNHESTAFPCCNIHHYSNHKCTAFHVQEIHLYFNRMSIAFPYQGNPPKPSPSYRQSYDSSEMPKRATTASTLAPWALVDLEMFFVASLAILQLVFTLDHVSLAETSLLATIPLHSFPRTPTVMRWLHFGRRL